MGSPASTRRVWDLTCSFTDMILKKLGLWGACRGKPSPRRPLSCSPRLEQHTCRGAQQRGRRGPMFLFRRGGVARGQGCPGGGVGAQRIRDPSGDSVSKNSGRPTKSFFAHSYTFFLKIVSFRFSLIRQRWDGDGDNCTHRGMKRVSNYPRPRPVNEKRQRYRTAGVLNFQIC